MERRLSSMVAGSPDRPLEPAAHDVAADTAERDLADGLDRTACPPAAVLGDLAGDGRAVRGQPAARAGQRQPQRAAVDAAVRRDPRDRRDRPDARDPAARARPLGARDDHADDDHRHEGPERPATAGCRRRSGSSLLACVASGLVSGIAITRLGVTPLVATLGVNALLTGVVLADHERRVDVFGDARPRALRARQDGRHSATP